MNIKIIKRYLASKIGARVVIIYYGSRNKKERYDGELYRVYQNVFTVKLLNGELKCFSYIDVLTKTVQMCI